MKYLKVLVILSVALCGSWAAAFVKRNSFQHEYKDKLYYFETFYKASFFKAFMACSKMGMNLWSIDSDEEFDKVHSFVKEKMYYKKDLMIWTSGAMKDIGQFHWMNTGNPVRSSRWWPTSPSNYDGRQFCLHIWYTENKFLLNDFRCDMESYFICESKKI